MHLLTKHLPRMVIYVLAFLGTYDSPIEGVSTNTTTIKATIAVGPCDCTDGDLIDIENGSFEDGPGTNLSNGLVPPGWGGAGTVDTGIPDGLVDCTPDIMNASCDGGQFCRMVSSESITQDICGIVVGEEYNISFSQGLINNWGMSSGHLVVQFGGDMIDAPQIMVGTIPTYPGFSGWEDITVGPFTAGATTQTLTIYPVSAADGVCPSGGMGQCNDPANGDINFCGSFWGNSAFTDMVIDGISICGPAGCCETDCSTTIEVDCDDGNPCTDGDVRTVDECDPTVECEPCAGQDIGACDFTISQDCDDGNPCTENDVEMVADCDNSMVCEPCAGEPIGSCIFTVMIDCDDGDPCTENDMMEVDDCDQSITCVPCAGTPVPCDSGVDQCERIEPCDDGDPCTENDMATFLVSDNSLCIPCEGIPIDCNNGDTQVVPCDDGDPTTSDDEQTILLCDGSICVPCMGIPDDCSTGNTINIFCDDGNPCTSNDMQLALELDTTIICGPCTGSLMDCGNGDTQVVPCDDGDPLTMNDMQTILTCDGSICVPCGGSQVDCASGDTIVIACTDGNPCTINDMQTVLTADTTVICTPCAGTLTDCSDGATQVVPCDDGDPSTLNDMQTILTCDGSICVPCGGNQIDCTTGSTSVIICDDNNPCTTNDTETILDSVGTVCIPCEGTLEVPFVEVDSIICSDDLASYEVYFNSNFTPITNNQGLPFNTLGLQQYSVLQIDSSQDLTITVQGTNVGCDSSFNVSPPNCDCLAMADAGPDRTIDCNQMMVTLGGTNTSIGNDFSFAWVNDLGVTVSNDRTYSTNMAGTYTLFVTDLIQNCVATSISVVDDIRNMPTAIILADPTNILDCTILQITLSTDPQLNVEYTWDFASQQSTGLEINISEPTTVQLVALDTISGCSNSSTLVIDQQLSYPIIGFEDAGVINCLIDEVSLSLNSTSTVGMDIVHQWLDSNNSPIGTGTNTMVQNAGLYIIESVDTTNGCTNRDTIVVSDDFQYPIVDAGSGYSLPCDGSTIELSATIDNPSNPVEWSSLQGNILSGGNTLAPTVGSEGWYYIEVTNPISGCKTMDSTFLNPVADAISSSFFEANQPLCTGQSNGSINLVNIMGGTPPIEYTLNSVTNTTGSFNNLQADTYTIFLVDSQGCEYDTTITITSPNPVDLSLEENSFELINNNIVDLSLITSVINIDSIIWPEGIDASCDNCLNPSLEINESGQYGITLVDENGCTASVTFNVIVKQIVNIYIPNSFSPNDDGINDFFYMFTDGNVVEILDFRVFDRWGGLLHVANNFAPDDTNFAWNGASGGKKVDPGVYVYYFKYIDGFGNEKIASGDVTVVR